MTTNQTDPKDQKQKAKDFSSDSKQSEKIVTELKKNLKLFKDDRGDAYARIENNGHFENWPVATRNKNFKIWVAYKGRKILGSAPSESAVKEAITTLEGEAVYNASDTYALFNRVGFENTPDEKKYWYDLADEHWSAIEITAKGWRVIKNPPILFKRYQHQLPQVIPGDKNNDIRLLDKYLRISEEQDKILIYVFLITSLIADIPHVCLLLHGQQGCSKTTLFKMLRSLIDPSRLEVVNLGTDRRSLILNLDQNWFCPFDNVSGLKKDISDIFCQVITGAGFSDRTLFTDDDPFIRSIKRVIGINGINVAAVQPDLLERSIMIELQSIDKRSRRSEEDLWKEFTADKAKIFGGMLDILSKAMTIKPSIVIDSNLRMADFALWGEAIARSMNFQAGYFMDAYNRNMDEINAQGIEVNSVATAVRIMVEKKVEHECERSLGSELEQINIWDGKPANLIDELTVIAKDNKIITDERDKYWPGQASAMSRHLNRIKPILEAEGIIVTTGERTATGRKITIVYQRPKSTDDTNNINNAGSIENKNPMKKGNLNNRIITDGTIQVNTDENIDTNSPIPPWKRNANKSQNDDHVGDDGKIPVDQIPF